MARKQKEPTVSPDLAILREARERYKAASDAEAQQRLQMLDDQGSCPEISGRSRSSSAGVDYEPGRTAPVLGHQQTHPIQAPSP